MRINMSWRIILSFTCCCCYTNDWKTQAWVQQQDTIVKRSSIRNTKVHRYPTTTTTTSTTALYQGKKLEAKTIQDVFGINETMTLAMIQKVPKLLTYEKDWLIGRIEWFQETLDTNSTDIARLVLSHNLPLNGAIDKKDTKIAAFQEILALDDRQVLRLLRKKPNMLSYKLETVKEKVENFADVFGYDLEKDRRIVGTIIVKEPSILSYKKETIDAKIQMFRKWLGGDDKKWLQKYLFQQPGLLKRDLETTEAKRQWLIDRLELDEEGIARCLRYSPSVFTRSIKDSLEPSVQWIEHRFNLYDTRAVGKLVCKFPSILTYSVEKNLEPKIAFFTNQVFDGDETKALSMLAHDPSLLSYSLEKRIRPRWKQCQELGWTELISINTMCKYTTRSWDGYIQRKMEQETTLR